MLEFVFAVLSLAVFVSGRTVQLNVGCSGDQCGNAWAINGKLNPDVICQNNDVIVFNIDAAGHPFYIKSKPVTGTASTFPGTIQGQQGLSQGQIALTCDELTQAASPLYYICGIHEKMKGRICVGSCDAFSGVGSGFEQFGSETPSQTQTPNTINTNNVTTPSPARPTQADNTTPNAETPTTPSAENTTGIISNATNNSGQVVPTLAAILAVAALFVARSA